METEKISFKDLGLDEETLRTVERKGFETPTPIQVLAIPRLLSGDANVIARARTGTGKTAAFGLPLVQRLRGGSDHVQALILEPTRELAVQTCTEMQSFTDGRHPRTCVVYGGASINTQLRELKRGCEIVVGTPGRVMDLINRGSLDISKIEYFILDEGDEMLDMGFIEDIEDIFGEANPDSRILLFSATMPPPILKIASDFMGAYEIVEEEEVVDEPLLIEQKYWILRENDKIEALVRLIDISDDFYGLVFTMTKLDADNVSKQLDERGYEVAVLHGDIMQSQREKVLARFRKKKTRILVATDVAARGIDIAGLSHVVNYSMPFDGWTYVHRIGRTGRAGAAGIAITFVRPEEARKKLALLQNAVRRRTKGELVEAAIPTVDEVLEKKRSRLFEQLKRDIGLAKDFGEQDENERDEELLNASGEKLTINNAVGQIETASVETSPAQNDELIINNLDEQNGELALTDFTEQGESQSQTAERALQGEGASSEETTASIEEVASAESAEKPAAHKSTLIKASAQFMRMAAELCESDDAEKVLAAVMSVLYGKTLDRSYYGTISTERSGKKRDRDRDRSRDRDEARREGGRNYASGGEQLRIYVQMGRRDGYGPRDIADFFSDLLNIPGRDVDRIDIAQNFTLLSLPASQARRALDMSQSDRSLPHMHVDTKEGGGLRGGFRDRDRGGFRDRDRGFRDSDSRGGFRAKDSFRDKGGRSAFRDEFRRDFGKRGGGRDRYSDDEFGEGLTHFRFKSRPNVHTPTERNSSSSFFKHRSDKPERF